MRKIIQIIILFLLVASCPKVQAQSKNDFKLKDYNGVFTINNSRLEEVGNELHLAMEILLNGRGIQSYIAVRLTPKIFSESNYKLLPDIIILGDNKRKTYERWLRTMSESERAELLRLETLIYAAPKTDTTFMYEIRIPYESWMNEATLALNQELIDYRDRRSLMVFALGGKVAPPQQEPCTAAATEEPPTATAPKEAHTTAAPKEPHRAQTKTNPVAQDSKPRLSRQQWKAVIEFPLGNSEIMYNYRRNFEELAKINQFLNEITANPDVHIHALYISGYTSPEGNYAANVELARERTVALRKYILKHFRLPVNQRQILSDWFVEDWKTLRREIETSNIADKKYILSIIDLAPNRAQCETQLKWLSDAWQALQSDFLPRLRRVELQIDFTTKELDNKLTN